MNIFSKIYWWAYGQRRNKCSPIGFVCCLFGKHMWSTSHVDGVNDIIRCLRCGHIDKKATEAYRIRFTPDKYSKYVSAILSHCSSCVHMKINTCYSGGCQKKNDIACVGCAFLKAGNYAKNFGQPFGDGTSGVFSFPRCQTYKAK